MSESLTIAENERRFVAQELHDHAIQTLLQMNMQVAICKRYLELGLTDETTSELNDLERQISLVSQQIRELITDLRPPYSEDGSFGAMLETQIEIHEQRGGPQIQSSYPTTIELSALKKLTLIRIIQESLLNIRKHAQASEIHLTLEQLENDLQLTITDNGKGFDDALIPNPFAEKGGAGMVNMQIRAKAVNGKFDIQAQPEQGTMVKVTIPL